MAAVKKPIKFLLTLKCSTLMFYDISYNTLTYKSNIVNICHILIIMYSTAMGNYKKRGNSNLLFPQNLA